MHHPPTAGGGDGRPPVRVVIDPVPLDEADRPVVEPDHEPLGGVVVAEQRAVAGGDGGQVRGFAPPRLDVGPTDPGGEEGELVLVERCEAEVHPASLATPPGPVSSTVGHDRLRGASMIVSVFVRRLKEGRRGSGTRTAGRREE